MAFRNITAKVQHDRQQQDQDRKRYLSAQIIQTPRKKTKEDRADHLCGILHCFDPFHASDAGTEVLVSAWRFVGYNQAVAHQSRKGGA
jgi:hypothetical protein